MHIVFITLLLAFARYTPDTPVVVKPGDKIIRYDWIRPAHDFYKNVIRDSAGNIKYEFMMENRTFVDSVNKRIVFARSRQVPAGDFSTDTSVTDLSLRPIRMHEIHYQRNVDFDMQFGETQVGIRTVRKGAASLKNYAMESGYFEDNMIEYIFGWLELKKGVVYRLDNFNKDTPSPSDPYLLDYAFDDEWDIASGYRIDCRVVHFIHGDTSGYLWIDKDAHRVLKVVGQFKNGSFVLTRQ